MKKTKKALPPEAAFAQVATDEEEVYTPEEIARCVELVLLLAEIDKRRRAAPGFREEDDAR